MKKSMYGGGKKSPRQIRMQKQNLRETIWKRIRAVEKVIPKTVEEALEVARYSRMWRKRLKKVSPNLSILVRPSHALVVDLWGKAVIYRYGTEHDLETVVKEEESVRNAGYRIVSLETVKGGLE